MATIYPFRALRYNPDLAPLGDVVTQPYDKITPEMQDRYYARSPYNLVRIILGKSQPGDDGQAVYDRAAKWFAEWRDMGVFQPDMEPSIYAYAQRFTVPGDPKGAECERRGFIALGKLEEYSGGIVHRHEHTLSGPKTDRLNLLRATRAHFGQIFMLYSDPGQEINQMLFSAANADAPDLLRGGTTATPAPAPEAEVTDEYGVRHRFWRVADPQVIRRVQEAMLNKKLIIADGHHRYETALNYRNERRAQAGVVAPDAPYERVMMTFVNMDAEGLVILPTHRVVFGLETFNPIGFVEAARPFFSVNALRERVTESTATVLLRQKALGTAMIATTPEADFILEARADCAEAERLLTGLSPQQKELDLVHLHKIVLERVLGISEEDIRGQKNVRYVRAAGDAIDQVRSGKAQVAFLVNPVRMEQVRDIAFAGEVLPQKSTDFYPKLLSGLTIYALE